MLVDSLRSSVAKGALICLHDMFHAYRNQLDPEFDRCTSACLRKTVDTNDFLSEEADRTLSSMCQLVSEAKGLSVVMSLASDSKQKNPKVRAKCVWCLRIIIDRLGPSVALNGDVDKLVQLLAKLLSESPGEVRSMARKAFVAMQSSVAHEEFERLLGRALGSAEALKIRQALGATPLRRGDEKAETGPLGSGSAESPVGAAACSPKRRMCPTRPSFHVTHSR